MPEIKINIHLLERLRKEEVKLNNPERKEKLKTKPVFFEPKPKTIIQSEQIIKTKMENKLVRGKWISRVPENGKAYGKKVKALDNSIIKIIEEWAPQNPNYFINIENQYTQELVNNLKHICNIEQNTQTEKIIQKLLINLKNLHDEIDQAGIRQRRIRYKK